MSDRGQQVRALFRATALEQLAQLARAVDALRRGAGDPEAEGAIEPTLHLMKGDAALVGLMEVAAALQAAEERAAAADWDHLASALAQIARGLEREDDEPGLDEPVEPALLRRWVRLQTDAIDELSNRLLELSTAYNRLSAGLVRAVRDAPAEMLRELARDADSARRQLDEVIGAAWSLRLASVEDLLRRLAAHAGELARAQKKPLRVRIDGGGAELERATLEVIEAPLLQLVRDAIVHGIEGPEARGDKPAEATLVLEARIAGTTVEIAVEDDGRGIDPAAVRAASIDAVSAELEGLGGAARMHAAPGAGARCVLAVPAAIARELAVVVECAGGLFALPARAVSARLRLGDHARRRVAGGTAIRAGQVWAPLCGLDEVLGLGAVTAAHDDTPVLLLEGSGRRRAFAVDRIDGEHELLRRPADALIGLRELVAASSVTADGRIALWPSVPALLTGRRAHPRRGSSPPVAPRSRRILVADDSPLVLDIVSSILRSASLVADTAFDGEAAWCALEQELPDLLVTDIDMPRLGGLELLGRVRARWPRLPVVVLTTRADEADRRRAMALGANAYLIKSELEERRLIELVRRLIDELP